MPREIAKAINGLTEKVEKLHAQLRVSHMGTLTKRQQVQLSLLNAMRLGSVDLGSPNRRAELLDCTAKLAEEFLSQTTTKP